jgi:hypothetical protein
MFEEWKSDPARAAGRLLAMALFGSAAKPKPAPRPAAAAPSSDADEPGAVDAAVSALSACLERFSSPAVCFEDRTRFAVSDAHRLAGESPVDTKSLSERIDSLRARIALLERRGLNHMPEFTYLREQCSTLTTQWRNSRTAQGELTGQQPAPPPPRLPFSTERA